VKLEASTALSQDNLEKKFDNLQLKLDTIFSKIALLAPRIPTVRLEATLMEKALGVIIGRYL
jgi:hypothetical protein